TRMRAVGRGCTRQGLHPTRGCRLQGLHPAKGLHPARVWVISLHFDIPLSIQKPGNTVQEK
ncbi:hypothetical protein JKG47_12885, partial [Acidithiobacillus sp. MC6.1]|nr:hypothetical protein [Acidithiobacillus sp. MC6.1]